MSLEMLLAGKPRPPQRSEIAFTVPGVYEWNVPYGARSVSLVCIGGGGGVAVPNSTSAGSAGGALAYVNALVVKPGDILTCQVSAGGQHSNTAAARIPEDTYVLLNGVEVIGLRGLGNTLTGKTLVDPTELPHGGGAINLGGNPGARGTYGGGGGGGAAGYSGRGGHGGAGGGSSSGSAGLAAPTGGGGGGGGGGTRRYESSSFYVWGGPGGSTGLGGRGESGAGGIAGRRSSNTSIYSFGGAGGRGSWMPGTPPGGEQYGFNVGGGKGGAGHIVGEDLGDLKVPTTGNISGGIRIIWPGDERFFPDTGTR